jgi:hypothetical protein
VSESFPEPPGDLETGGWAGEPGDQLFTAGGVIASRGGDMPALPAEASSVVDGVTDITGALGPKFYTFDAAGNRTAAARPGE